MLLAITIPSYVEAHAQSLSLHLPSATLCGGLCVGLTIGDNMAMCPLMTGMPLRTRACHSANVPWEACYSQGGSEQIHTRVTQA